MKKKEKFVPIAFHCSGGNGDTFNILGVFDDLGFTISKIRQLQVQNPFRMMSIDHGFFVYVVDPNQPYLSLNEGACLICSVRYQIVDEDSKEADKWKEAWYSRKHYEAMRKVGYTSPEFLVR